MPFLVIIMALMLTLNIVEAQESVTYNGVTESGINTGYNPNDIFGGRLVLWVRGDNGITIDTTSTASVSQWNDLSTYGNHLHQVVKVQQPGHLTNAVNGHMAVRFRGDPFFLCTTNTVAPSLFSIAGADKPYSLFACLRSQTNATAPVAFGWGRAGSNNGRLVVRPSGTAFNLNHFKDDNGAAIAINASLTTIDQNTNRFDIISIVSDGINTIQRKNGFVSTNQNFDVGTIDLATFGVGAHFRNNAGSVFWHGEIAEILVVSNQVSNLEEAGVRTYLNHRYQRQ